MNVPEDIPHMFYDHNVGQGIFAYTMKINQRRNMLKVDEVCI